MKTVDIHEAKTSLSRLIERVEAGEEIVIARAGRPVARLIPINCGIKPVRTGGLRLQHDIPDDFDTMFESEIEALFSGSIVPPKARNARRR